jgi:hypothetical protein
VEFKIKPDGAPWITVRTPFLIGLTCAVRDTLVKELTSAFPVESLTSEMTFGINGSDDEIEARRAAQQIKDENRILERADEIRMRRRSAA